MYPVLLQLGPLKIHSYGFMLALGFLVGIYLAGREAKRLGESEDHLNNLVFWILISAIIGSRLFHVIVFWDEMPGFWSAFKIWEGGLVYYGGFLGAVAASVFYTRWKKLDFWQYADIISPSIALGLMFGRTGCTLVGCCYGKPCPTDFPLAIVFPPQTIGMANTPLYPTQPAEAFGSLMIFLFLWLVVRKRRTFRGQVLAIFILLYSVLRTILEFWRADPRGFIHLFSIHAGANQTIETAGGIFGWLLWAEALKETTPGLYDIRISESQMVSLVLSIGVIVFWIVKSRRDSRLGVEVGPAPAPKTKSAPNNRKGRKGVK